LAVRRRRFGVMAFRLRLRDRRRAVERERLALAVAASAFGALGALAFLRRRRLGVLAFLELLRVLADRERLRLVERDADRLTLVVDGAFGAFARLRRLGAFAFLELRRVLAVRERERLADRDVAVLGALGTDAFLLDRDRVVLRRRGDFGARAVRLRARRLREDRDRFLRGAGDAEAAGLGALGTEARRLREDRDRERRRRLRLGCFTLRAFGEGDADAARFFRSAFCFSWNAFFSAWYCL